MQYAVVDDDNFPALLVGARRGERDSIEPLFADMQPRLLRFLRASEPRVADDLAGEVWLGVANGIAGFDGDLQGFRAWVFTIARRRVADFRRTAARRRTEPVDVERFNEEPGPPDPLDIVNDRLAAQRAVDLVVSSLPPDQAEVLLLRVLSGLDVDRVAEVMDRSPNWVRVMQHRGLRRLASALAPELGADLGVPSDRDVIEALPGTILST